MYNSRIIVVGENVRCQQYDTTLRIDLVCISDTYILLVI